MTDDGVRSAARTRAGGTRWPVWALTSVIAVVLVAAAAVRWWPAREQSPEEILRLDDDVDEPLVVNNPGFVGPRTCASCHAARVEEFQRTRHFRACWPAELGPMPPGFGPQSGQYTSHRLGVRFEMTKEGPEHIQSVIRESGGKSERLSSTIAYVYGSEGRADEVYFTWKGDRLYELPMSWLHPQKGWAEEPVTPIESGEFLRTTTKRCVDCHNTWMAHVPGTENQYRRDGAILGVTCERCHGPGRDHVAFHQGHPDERKARSIVQPDHLSREQQMDVCGQCHSNAILARGPAFSYRPGEPLDAHFRSLTFEGIENDHVADQVKYLRRSKCFQNSESLTCTTCHNPHRSSSADPGNRACIHCHKPAQCKEQERLPTAVRGECVSCHMPQYYRVAIKFHLPDDQYIFPMRPHEHRIAVYPAARDEVLLNWHRKQPGAADRQNETELTKSLTNHWLTEGHKLQRSHRLVAAIGAIREAQRIDPAAANGKLKDVLALQNKIDEAMFTAQRNAGSRRFAEAITGLELMLALNPTDAKAHGKLGTLYAGIGRNDRAFEHLQAVAKHDPDDPYGHNMLGWIAYLKGDGERAIQSFRQADEILPYSAEINHRWGLALIQLGHWSEAEKRFRHVLKIDPAHAGGCQGLGLALSRQGKTEEAIAQARRAVRLTQMQNADTVLTLTDVYAAASRWREANAAASLALKVAEKHQPEMAPQIRRRQSELQKKVNP